MKMPGNLNMKNMMKQAEKMKKQMEEIQEKAGNEIVETTSGGGMVKVEAKAKGGQRYQGCREASGGGNAG